jgi:hypothetical protein
VGYFDVNLEFFGVGDEAGDRDRSLTINQRVPFLAPRLLRRVAKNFYLGAGYHLVTVTAGFTNLPDWLPGDIQELLREGIKIRSSGLGLVAEYDSRDNEFNAFSGSYLLLTSNFAREALGGDRDYEQYNAGYNCHGKVGKDKVLAWRATGCVSGGGAPFCDICLIGGENDRIRGYVGGQYRDEVSLTTQLEYRWRFYKEWGMVAFAGVGQVAPSIGDMSTDNLQPSYGVRIRFMASEEHMVNLGIDYARGKDSDAWYFRIREPFWARTGRGELSASVPVCADGSETSEDRRSGDQGRQDASIEEPPGFAFAQHQGVDVGDRDVGPHPRLQHTGPIFPTGGIGRPVGVSAQGFLGGQGLLRVPATGWLQLLVAAGDGCVQTVENVMVGARQVGTEGQWHAGLSKGSPRVRSLDSLGAEPVLRPALVLDAVGWLHRRDDAGRCKAREIVGVDHLRVLDAVAERSCLRAGPYHRLQKGQSFPVPGVADGVNPDLEPRAHHLRCELLVESVVGAADA